MKEARLTEEIIGILDLLPGSSAVSSGSSPQGW